MRKRLPRGVLVAFEGIDGAGKTTQARALVDSLLSKGYDAVYTKEPTDGIWGEKIRHSAMNGRMSLEEELSAFLEDRREHVRDFIGPAMGAGQIVILDRYYFSTAAYQGARGADASEILRTNESFAPNPDLLILLEISVAVAMERIRMRGSADNHFEKADALERSAVIFRALDKPYILRLDGTRPIPDLAEDIRIALQEGPMLNAELSAKPSIPSQKVPAILAEVRRIQYDDSIAMGDKAEAVRQVVLRASV
jgi:dTMP kinase